MLLTGSHNYKKTVFDLIKAGLIFENGLCIGAAAMVCPGVTAASQAVLTGGSEATANLAACTVYQGNPALKVRSRLYQ